MTYLITAIGIVYIVFGVAYFIKPDYTRILIDYFKIGKRAYIGGVVRLVIGGLLLIAAQKALVPWVPRIIGILAVIGGALFFALGLQRVNAIMEWFRALSDNRIRILAVIAELVGILLVYSA